MCCLCTDPETILCSRCIYNHNEKSPGTVHQPLRLQQLPYRGIPGYFERLHTRMGNIAKIREQAVDNIRDVDRAIENYSSHIEATIWELMTKARRVIGELNDVKEELSREINAGLAEMERTLEEDQPVLITQYGPMLRSLTEKPQPFRLFRFDFQIDAPPQTSSSGAGLLTQRTMESNREILVVIYENVAELHNLKTPKTERHELAMNFREGGSFVELGSYVLCFGNSPASNQVYSLELDSFKLTPRTPLNIARKAPGLAKASGFIYVFGGKSSSDGTLSECERWSIQDQVQGVILNSMYHPRAFFTPCSFRSLIYLASADAHRAVETFNLKTEAFALLPISLPAELITGKYSVGFIAQGELVIITSGSQVVRWEVGSEKLMTLETTNRSCWSGQVPVVLEHQVLIACEGRVEKFNLETFSFAKR